MSDQPAKPCLKVCETCPWLKKNQGKKHKAGWYTKANLIRLWNGLRKGDAPGMVCHSSDPDSIEYGATVPIKPTVERRDCGGAILAVGKHIQQLNKCKTPADFKAYKERHERPMTKIGIAVWIERLMFGGVPDVENRMSEINVPDGEKTDGQQTNNQQAAQSS